MLAKTNYAIFYIKHVVLIINILILPQLRRILALSTLFSPGQTLNLAKILRRLMEKNLIRSRWRSWKMLMMQEGGILINAH